MLQISSFILTLFLLTFSFAESHWLDSYQLTDLQRNLLLQWESEERFEHAKLVNFAEAYQRHNLKPKPYVPEHTAQQLLEVSEWAEGNAFSVFAEFAGYQFDSEAYMNDCPSRVLFNFGYATGKEYFQIDILERYIRTFDGLQIMYSVHPETFAEEFIALAKSRGFDVYLNKTEQVASL